MKDINRSDQLWRELFLHSWKTLFNAASAAKGETEAMQGPRIAQQAAALADDAMREVLYGRARSCSSCNGVGCPACKYSGRELEDEQHAS
jgi:hypothetical protein